MADSYVDASQPTVNQGANTKIRTDGSPVVRSYIRFDVSGWVPGASHATLRLFPNSSINTGLQIVRVPDTTWGERTVTFANAPPLGALIGTTPAPKTSVWTSLDVTSAVTGNGLVSLGVTSADPTAEALAAREAGAATAPQLVIDTPAAADTTAPTPVLTNPADGAQVATGTPTLSGTAGTATGDLATVAVLIWPGTDTSGPPPISLPATALAGGAFSVAPATALADGRYTAIAEQRDEAGNTGRSPARTFTIDTAAPAPTVTAPAAGTTTTDSTPTFAGSGGTASGDAAGVSVQVWRGTDTSATPALALNNVPRDPATGAFSVDAASALADGLYTLRVQQSDAAGNSGASALRTFSIDTQGPSPALTTPPAGSTTGDSTPTFAGSAGTAAGDAPTVTVKAWTGSATTGPPALTVTGVPRDPTTGAFSADAPSPLADGLYTALVEQSDAAGHTGTSATRTFTIDTATPPATLLPVADSMTDASLPSTNYGTNVKIRTDGSPVVRSYIRFDVSGWVPGSSRATLRLMPTSSLNTGLQVVRVADTTWGERTITAANQPPLGTTVATTSPPTAGTSLTVDVTAAIGGNGPTSLALTSTNSTAEALASREAGPATAPQLVIDHPDSTAPTPSLATPADGALLDATPTFTGTAGTAPGDAATVDVVIWNDLDTDETPLMTLPAVALAGGAFSVTPSTPLPDDVYTVRVDQRDAAGNVGQSATRSFTLDTVGPAPTLHTPAEGAATNDSTPTLAGHGGTAAGDADHVTVELAGATFDAPVDAGTGAFSVHAPGVLADGDHSAVVRQDDAAGHHGTSAPRAFTVDTAAPAVALTEPADGSTTTDTTPALAGTAGTGSGDAAQVRVDLWDGTDTSGDPVASANAAVDPSTGGFSAEPAGALDGGTYTARARQTDAAGNAGTSAPITFIVDAPDVTAPRPSLTAPADGSFTNDTTPRLAGRAGSRPGDLAELNVRVWSGSDTSAVPVAEIPATRAADGSFEVDPPSALAPGPYTARADQDDAAGNHGHSATVAFTVDITAPGPVLTSPANGSSSNNPKPTFSGSGGTAPGDDTEVTVRVWPGTSATGDPAFTLHATRASDGSFSVPASDPLTPGTYTARAEQEDAAGNHGNSAPVTFTFTGLPDPTIAAAGDISCATTSTGGSCRQMATSDLLLGMNPDAVLALGDIQYEAGEYANYLAQFDPSWGRLKAKIYPAIGNHEYGTSVGTSTAASCDVVAVGDPRSYACGYFDYFNGKGNFSGRAGDRGQGYYAFDVGPWRIYSVNSNCGRPGAPSCAAGGAQEQWLRNDLASHPRACQLMIVHHPMFTSDVRQFDTPAFRAQLMPLWRAFDDYGGDVVLAGHSHFYERYLPQTPDGVATPNGIQQFVVGTGGRNVYDVDPTGIEPNSVVHNGSTFGALQLKLQSASYDWQFVPIPGQTFTDTGSRACH